MKKKTLFFIMLLLLGAACFSAPLIDVAPTLHQSCAQVGYCYPPAKSALFSQTAQTLTLLSFFGFGLLLAFTPCVLPMVPILSSIILGRRNLSPLHAFLLSLFYVLGMALVYACIGFFFGFLGQNIQLFFQNKMVILVMAGLIGLMALSMFGGFALKVPEKWQQFFSAKSEHQKRGTYLGAFVMGALSTLILSPCVSPALVAALGYIGQTGDAWLGGSALFLMGLGSGTPLLLIGMLGPKILPKPGRWMTMIKIVVGILLLGVAVMTASRAFQNPTTSVLNFEVVHTVADIETALKKHPTDVIMLDFYANWCASCHELEKSTFANPVVQQKLLPFILLRVDMSHNSLETAAIMQHYAVIAPPTLLFFKKGVEIPNSRIVGYVPPEKFINLLPSAAN